MLKEGLTHTSRMVVAVEDTAEYIGSGDMPVFASPRMFALMENAAMLAVADHLPEGCTTVGGHLHSNHVRPSAVGSEVSATATLVKVEGKKLEFDIEAYDGDELIGQGHHTRFIVDREKFLRKVHTD